MKWNEKVASKEGVEYGTINQIDEKQKQEQDQTLFLRQIIFTLRTLSSSFALTSHS